MLLWVLLSVSWLFECLNGQDITYLLEITDDPTTVLFYNDACPTGVTRWNLSVQESGLGLDIVVNQTILDSDNDEYLAISADSSFSGDKASIAYATGNLSDIKFAIPFIKTGYIAFYPGNNCNLDQAFNLTIRQYEEKVPEPPPTTPNPYPPTGFQTSILVYISGKTLKQFMLAEFVLQFQTFIQQEAYKFAKDIKLEGIVTTKPVNETVFFTNVQRCSSKWDNYETCVELFLAVYLTQPKTDYELTETHLEAFWARIGEKGFPDALGVQPYEFADVSLDILWWSLWIFIAVVVTIGIGYGFWRLNLRAVEEAKFLRELEEQERRNEIFAGVELRKPNLRMSKYQTVPKYMMGDADSESVLSAPAAAPAPSPTFKPALKTSPRIVPQAEPPPLLSPTTEGRPTFYSNAGFLEEDEDDDDEEVAHF